MGQTATNPQTGEQLQLLNGQWMPLTATNPTTGQKLRMIGGAWQPFQPPTPPHTPTPTDPIKGHGLGAFLPFSVTRQGNLQWDTPPVLDQVLSAVQMPGKVARGETIPYGTTPEGKVMIDPQVQNDLRTLAMTFGPVNPAVRAGDLAIPGEKTNLTHATPTEDALAKIGNKGFEDVRRMSVDSPPQIFKDWSVSTEQALNDRGLSDVSAPRVVAELRKFQSFPEDVVSVSPNNIIAFRQSMQRLAQSTDKGEQEAARSSIRALDDLLGGPTFQGASTGPAAEFAQAYDEAKANRAAAFRAEALGKKELQAELRTNAANSGRNLGNNLRARAADLLLHPEKLAGWSEDEIAALVKINEKGGMAGANAIRMIGNKLGGGGGLGNTFLAGGGASVGGTVGAYFGGPVGAAIGGALGVTPALAGHGFRGTYNAIVSNAFDALEQKLLQRSPAFEQAASTVATNPAPLISLLRALLLMPKEQPKPSTADELYLSVQKQREAWKAANEQMQNGLP